MNDIVTPSVEEATWQRRQIDFFTVPPFPDKRWHRPLMDMLRVLP
jgi:hypothetical protein